MSQLSKRIGATIRAKRKVLRIKQNDLAERLGIRASHLCEIEKGKKYPSIELLWDIEAEIGSIWENL